VKVRRKGSGWQARWYESSTGKVRGKTFPSKAQAEAFQAKMLSTQRDGSYVDPSLGRITLAKWAEQYLERSDRLRPATKAAYGGALRRQILPGLGHRPLATIRPLDVQEWADKLRTAGYSSGTIHLAYRVLRAVLEGARKDGRIASNPAQNLRLKTTDRDSQEMRILEPPEIQTLADAVQSIEPRFRALIPFLAYTGLRIGEASALRTTNLNLAKREVVVAEGLSEGQLGPTKTGRSRVVSLPRLVVSELKRHLESFPPTEAGIVFASPQGGYLNRHNFYNRVWYPALKRAGLQGVRVHDLRHTAVSLAIRAGASPREAMDFAGHSSIAVTMNVYGHLFPGQGLSLADRLDELAQTWPAAKQARKRIGLKRASEQAL
jgi:integrase